MSDKDIIKLFLFSRGINKEYYIDKIYELLLKIEAAEEPSKYYSKISEYGVPIHKFLDAHEALKIHMLRGKELRTYILSAMWCSAGGWIKDNGM